MVIPGLKSIEDFAADVWGIETNQIFERTRKRSVVEARHTLMVYRYIDLGYTMEKAGEFYNLDHASVNHARKTVNILLKTDRTFRKKHELFYKMIQ